MSINMKLLRTKAALACLILLLIIIGGIIALHAHSNHANSSTTTSGKAATPEHPSVVFRHPSSWAVGGLTNTDVSQGLIARLGRAAPDASLLIRETAISTKQPIDYAQSAKDTISSLQSDVPGFKLVSSDTKVISGVSTIDISYEQTGTGTPLSNYMTIIPRSPHVYYLVYTTNQGQIAAITPDIQALNSGFVSFLLK